MITPNIYQKFVQWEFIFGCFELFIIFLMRGPQYVYQKHQHILLPPGHFVITVIRLISLLRQQQEEISHVL
jgi:hypothetical protein